MPRTPVPLYLSTAAGLSLLLSAAIFGFFYAWVCSTMWGLDAIDPRVAIAAMNGMNASVRNAVFAPAFFGTGPILLATAGLAALTGHRGAAGCFVAAGAAYLAGAFAVTLAVNVPMNQALMAAPVPQDIETAAQLWQDYSGRWQVYNLIRTLVTATVLGLCAMGVVRLAQAR